MNVRVRRPQEAAASVSALLARSMASAGRRAAVRLRTGIRAWWSTISIGVPTKAMSDTAKFDETTIALSVAAARSCCCGRHARNSDCSNQESSKLRPSGRHSAAHSAVILGLIPRIQRSAGDGARGLRRHRAALTSGLAGEDGRSGSCARCRSSDCREYAARWILGTSPRMTYAARQARLSMQSGSSFSQCHHPHHSWP